MRAPGKHKGRPLPGGRGGAALTPANLHEAPVEDVVLAGPGAALGKGAEVALDATPQLEDALGLEAWGRRDHLVVPGKRRR